MNKKINYLFAFAVFASTLLILNFTALILSSSVSIAGFLAGGQDGVMQAYTYLNDNINFYTALVYIVLLCFFSLWYYFGVIRTEGMEKYICNSTRALNPVSFVWLFLLALGSHAAVSIVMAVIAMLMPATFQSYIDMVNSSGMNQYSIMWVVSTLILPPFVEEIIFRGLLLKYLQRAGAGFVVANILQAVCFGIYHMNIVQGIYAALLGFLLGWLAYRYDSLIAPMFLHLLFNLFGTVLAEFESRFLPEFLQGVIVLQGIPLVTAAVVLIHFHVGEKKRTDGGNIQ